MACSARGAGTLDQAASACRARVPTMEGHAIAWHQARVGDAVRLDQWCRAVGPVVFVPVPATGIPASPPPLEDLVVVTWNTHLAEGRLPALIESLRSGRLTAGRPVERFVLLLQEAVRHGDDVPVFAAGARAAAGLGARDANAPDAAAQTARLGLAFLYVPAVRNGADAREDRGNAIVSTEPLLEPVALELPLERQRRVAVGAAIDVRVDGRPRRLTLLNAHLETVSAPRSLWFFRNPRPSQARALLAFLGRHGPGRRDGAAGAVLGGDFNTVQYGAGERAYGGAHAWSSSLASEDTRDTHAMGRLDYLFFRITAGWRAATHRLEERFGSDHYPLLGRFEAPSTK